MKAVFLVGGFGIRLRPFTFTTLKPLISLANIPILEHQIDALTKAGVREIILCVGYRPEQLEEAQNYLEEKYDISVHISQEIEPLGTAGPLAICREILLTDDEPFFMLNSDIICDFSFQDMLNFHYAHGKEGTLCITQVPDASRYGLVVFEQNSKLIKEFLEKPTFGAAESSMQYINAGIYQQNKSVLNRIPKPDPNPKCISIERFIFPSMVSEKQLAAMELTGFWMDIGQPQDFLKGTHMYLELIARKNPKSLSQHLGRTVLVHSSAKVGANCSIGPDVVIGENCCIGDGVFLENTTVMAGTTIHDYASIHNSIIGLDCKINRWSKIVDSFIGEGITIKENIIVYSSTICPFHSIKNHVFEKSVI